MRILRPFGLMMLCLALFAGSIFMVAARGQAAALSCGGTTLVICSGYGVMTVTLDDQGNPVGPIHPCPDCLAGIAAYLAPDLPLVLPIRLSSHRVAAIEVPQMPRKAAVLLRHARGPPSEV